MIIVIITTIIIIIIITNCFERDSEGQSRCRRTRQSVNHLLQSSEIRQCSGPCPMESLFPVRQNKNRARGVKLLWAHLQHTKRLFNASSVRVCPRVSCRHHANEARTHTHTHTHTHTVDTAQG
jgi:hypothetical protein